VSNNQAQYDLVDSHMAVFHMYCSLMERQQ
jgi:hypothetical protein